MDSESCCSLDRSSGLSRVLTAIADFPVLTNDVKSKGRLTGLDKAYIWRYYEENPLVIYTDIAGKLKMMKRLLKPTGQLRSMEIADSVV